MQQWQVHPHLVALRLRQRLRRRLRRTRSHLPEQELHCWMEKMPRYPIGYSYLKGLPDTTFPPDFFSPIPCTYTSLPLDGMARNYYYYYYFLHGYARACDSSCLDPFNSYLRGEKKNIWTELESNPGPPASQATTLTTRPWLLGHLSL